MPRRVMILPLVLVCTVGFLRSSEIRAATPSTPSATQLMEAAAKSFRQGAPGQAAIHWSEAARLFESQGQVNEQGQALIHLAEALQQMGEYRKAAISLQAALHLAEKTNNRTRTAIIHDKLGTVLFALGDVESALKWLNSGLSLAREEKKPALEAVILNDLGNVLASQYQNSEAIRTYSQSIEQADAAGQRVLAATAEVNRAMASIQEGLYADAKTQLDHASTRVRDLDNSRSKAYAWLNIGLGYDDLRSTAPSPRRIVLAQARREAFQGSRGLGVKPAEPERPAPTQPVIPSPPAPDDQLARLSADSLQAGLATALATNDATAESYALGYLGQLYERERRYEDALDLTRRAVLAAQKVNAPESLYRWHWQTARLLKAQGHENEALAAYKRAVQILQPIRHEFSYGFRTRRTSFRESVGPLFFELADLLLKRASATSEPTQYEQLLIQARDTAEAFKVAELQDYFRDQCVRTARAERKSLEQMSKTTAIIYPIMLPDRLELLVSLPTGLKRFAVPVTADGLTEVVRSFRKSLEDRRSKAYMESGQQLYGWLIRPLELDLTALKIDTLVFVPDGALRTIPLAPLHDGKEFLIQRYALAVTPGMELTDPRPLNRANVKLLSVGLTDAVQGFPALPNVAAEVNAVKGLYGGKLLLNDQFLVPKVEQEMKGQQYSIVHIASHGMVDNEADKSFVLAYDDKITMDRLSQLIGLAQFRETPLELLTLSACETAAGDDRAALGLAGVAIKAGARSALATLWFIDDAATADLVTEFYKQLQDPTVSKAKALQRAQLKILTEPQKSHPTFWAPFLLINNWL